MKTTKLFLIPAILVALTFASCSDYDNGFTVNQIKYDKAFIDAFGNIDPNQDWNLVKQLEEKNGRSTRVAETGWENLGYTKPNSITQEEIDKVLAVFNQKGKESYEPLVNWSDFFVQHVWKGTASYTAGNNGTVVGGDHMDGLCAYNPVTNHDDHVNNFNNAFGSIMLMINSSTQRFGYNSTEDGQVHYYFRMEYIDGAYYVGLDFSAEGQNPNQQVQRDYIYNDWIIKIVPANGETPDPPKDQPDPEPTEEIIEAGLLCCEDLGGEEADFDFNDIVLKLEHKRVTTTKNSAVSTKDIFVVTAMAAGGTLPSYVFYKPLKNADDFEFDFADDWMADAWKNGDGWVPFKTEDDNVSNGVHDMWAHEDLSGQTSFEPLNVGQEFDREGHSWKVDITPAIEAMRAYENSNEVEQEEIRHYADHYVSYVFDRGRIRIYVNPVMNADGSVNTNDENSKYIEPLRRGGNSDVADENIVSQTPRMLLLPLRFEWPTESTFIGDAYKDFGKWVNDANITEWYLNKDDNSVTSRDVVGHEELQPRLRWGSNSDGATEEIYMSVTLKSGESMTIPFTTLSGGDLTPSSSDNNIAYATNVDKNRKQITITANNPGTTTITLTQDAWTGVVDGDSHQYRSESIMLYVTVEGGSNPKENRSAESCKTSAPGIWDQSIDEKHEATIAPETAFTINVYDYQFNCECTYSVIEGSDLVTISSNRGVNPTSFKITAGKKEGKAVVLLTIPEITKDGKTYNAKTFTITVKIEGYGTPIQAVGQHVYKIDDVLDAVGNSAYITFTFTSGGYGYEFVSAKNGSPDWISRTSYYNCTPTNSVSVVTVEASFFNKLKNAGYTQFYINGNLSELYVKVGSASAKRRTIRR